MQLLFYVNCFGVILSAAFIGSAFSANYGPSYAFAAGTVFGIGLVLPFLGEYGRLSSGFHEVEKQFDQTFKRSTDAHGEIEIYVPGQKAPRHPWQQGRGGRRLLYLFAIVGVVLLAIDAGGYIAAKNARTVPTGVITNY